MPTDYRDRLIDDFLDSLFQQAFKQYFAELGIAVKNWAGLFAEMNGQEGNLAFVRTASDGSVIGFIQFIPISFTSWFFEAACGFIREFWVAEAHRGMGHGSALLGLAEEHFRKNGIHAAILTTDTAAGFYQRRGYMRAEGCRAKNEDAVFFKQLASE